MKYYKRVDGNGNTTTVESYWHDKPVIGALEITAQEYDAFIASLPSQPNARNVAEAPPAKATASGFRGLVNKIRNIWT